jgi:predicted tellurium resistance membrane protein TerC
VILVFIGLKMLVEHWVKITTGTSLLVIGAVLTTSVLMSWLIPAKSSNAKK